MPGIDARAPERTDTSSGFFESPKTDRDVAAWLERRDPDEHPKK